LGWVTVRDVIAAGLLLVLACAPSVPTAEPGVLEGHLRIVSQGEVDLAGGQAAEIPAEVYAEYPLVVRRANGGEEIEAVVGDREGNYRVSLPAGEYVLDVKDRARRHVRTKPKRFKVVSGEIVRVDMEIDTGVR
jgi:hypothetical protein